jgi:hypothetical protein
MPPHADPAFSYDPEYYDSRNEEKKKKNQSTAGDRFGATATAAANKRLVVTVGVDTDVAARGGGAMTGRQLRALQIQETRSLQQSHKAPPSGAAAAWEAGTPRKRGRDNDAEMTDGGQAPAVAAGEEEEEVEDIKKRMRLVSAQLSQMTRKQSVFAAVLEQSKASVEERSVHIIGLRAGTPVSAVGSYFARCGAVRRVGAASGGDTVGQAPEVADSNANAATVEFASITSVVRAVKLSGSMCAGATVTVRRTVDVLKAAVAASNLSATASAFKPVLSSASTTQPVTYTPGRSGGRGGGRQGGGAGRTGGRGRGGRGSMKWVRSDAEAAAAAAATSVAAAAAGKDAMVA